MTRVLVVLAVLAVLIIGAVGTYFIWFAPQPAGVELEFQTPAEVSVGQPFEVAVHFSNPNNQIIKNARMSLILPEGISFVGKSSELKVSEQMIGDIGPGSLNRQSFNLIVTNGVQSVKRILAKITYGLESNPSAEFESKKEANISIGQSSISLSFSAAEKVFAGQNFDIGINYVNNTDQDLENVQLKLEYPPVFQYKESSVEPLRGNNYWDLGALSAGKNGELAITGNLVGQGAGEDVFNGIITASYQGQTYTISGQEIKIGIATSPLVIGIQVNGSSEGVLNFGQTARYVISYRNNSNTSLANLSIEANLTGQALDLYGLRTEGSLNSVRNTITWNKATTPSLSSISPGGVGSVSFDVQLKKQFTPTKSTDKNYSVQVDAQIESPTVPGGASGDKTVSMTGLESKLAGYLSLETKALFRDASSGILNSGPYPPKANTPTRYTIHWILKNHTTDMGNARVSAFLRPNTKFTGTTKSTTGSKPEYNSQTGEVFWDVGSIAAAQGIVGGKLEAIFQVENTPSVNEVGQNSNLISESKLTAKDLFTDMDVSGSSPAIDTSLPSDAGSGSTNRAVGQ